MFITRHPLAYALAMQRAFTDAGEAAHGGLRALVQHWVAVERHVQHSARQILAHDPSAQVALVSLEGLAASPGLLLRELRCWLHEPDCDGESPPPHTNPSAKAGAEPPTVAPSTGPCAGQTCGTDCIKPCPAGHMCAAVMSYCQADGTCGRNSRPDCPAAAEGPRMQVLGATVQGRGGGTGGETTADPAAWTAPEGAGDALVQWAASVRPRPNERYSGRMFLPGELEAIEAEFGGAVRSLGGYSGVTDASMQNVPERSDQAWQDAWLGGTPPEGLLVL